METQAIEESPPRIAVANLPTLVAENGDRYHHPALGRKRYLSRDTRKVTLGWVDPSIKIWLSPQKGPANDVNTGRIYPPKTWIINSGDEPPISIWVEACAPIISGRTTLSVSLLTPDDQQVCDDSVMLSVIGLDLSAKGHDFDNPTSAGIDIAESDEESPGAYAHFNCDNDNSSTDSSTKYPGGDFAENSDSVTGENDLKALSLTMSSAMMSGKVVLRRSSANAQVWSSSEKGSANAVLTGATFSAETEGNGKKTWDLSDEGERSAFAAVSSSPVWVEGAALGSADVTLTYVIGERDILSDKVHYTFIAATCGDQPTIDDVPNVYNPDPYPGSYITYNQRAFWEMSFPSLVRCEWSIVGEVNTIRNSHSMINGYNCIAWAGGITTKWLNKKDIDYDYGDKDDVFEMSDMDAYFWATRGLRPSASGPEDAEVMYYDSYHAATRSHCGCGAGKWLMFTSKCGLLEVVEHNWDQLSGFYGSPTRFYKTP